MALSLAPNSKIDEFTKDKNGNITEINGRTLVVKNLTAEAGEPYFQAWVDGRQNDGSTHNEAVENALKSAPKSKRSN